MTINFKCPYCGHDRLQEVSHSVTLTDEIFGFDELYNGEVEIEYAPDSREIGWSDELPNTIYECAQCGFTPEIDSEQIHTAKELYGWLKERSMLE